MASRACCYLLGWALLYPSVLPGTLICFYGADLDQDKAKDTAKDLVDYAVKGGAKGSVGSNISGSDIFNSMKTADGTCYDAATGKFTCDGGILLIYISAHGDSTEDGKDTIIGNFDQTNHGGNVKLGDLTKSIAGTIPECCTVIFAIDACFTDVWWNNFIKPGADGSVNPNNPFKDLNFMIAAPNGVGKCFGTPVGSALSKAFGTDRTVTQLSDFLGSQENVHTTWSLDDDHNYKIKLTPEPETIWLTAAGLAALLRLRQRRPTRRRRPG